MNKAGFIFLCLLLGGPSAFALAQADNEREVVAAGIGTTEEEAKKQAYRAAVQNVVGAMVVGETLVQNDDLVEEKILSYSDGYVTKAEQVGATKVLEGGLLSVTMKVTVRSDRLKEKLAAENIITIEADGEDLMTQWNIQRENRRAQEGSSQEAQKNAAAIVADAIKGFPASLLDASADFNQATTLGEGGGSTVSVVIPITVSVNQERYRTFASQLKKTLKDLGLDYKTLTLPIFLVTPSRPEVDTGAIPYDIRTGKGKKPYLLINEIIDLEGKQSRWALFFLTEEIFETLTKCFKQLSKPSVVIELLDVEGEVVVEQEFDIAIEKKDTGKPILYIIDASTPSGYSREYTPGHGYIAPIVSRDRARGTDLPANIPEVFKITFVMSTEELQRVKSIRCGVPRTSW